MKSVVVAVLAAIISLTTLGTGPAKAAAAGALATSPVGAGKGLLVNVQRRGEATRGARRARAAGRRARSGRRAVRRSGTRRRAAGRNRTVRRRNVRRRTARRNVRRGRVVRGRRAGRRYVPRRRRARRTRRIIRYGLYAAPALSYYYYDVYPRRCAWMYHRWRRTGSRYWRRRFINCMNRYY